MWDYHVGERVGFKTRYIFTCRIQRINVILHKNAIELLLNTPYSCNKFCVQNFIQDVLK